MHFTLKQLRYVDAVGKLGSIATASEELMISQSSIIAALESLEYELGFDIFIRLPAKGIRPTSTGVKVLDEIQKLIRDFVHFENYLISDTGELTGVLNVACHHSTSQYVLPFTIKSFAERYPFVTLDILEGYRAEIIRFVESGKAQSVFAFQPTLPSHWPFRKLFEARLHAVLPIDDPLARQEGVWLEQLAKRPMIAIDLPMNRDIIGGIFQSRGLQPLVAQRSSAADLVRALIGAGLGYGLFWIRIADELQRGLGICVRPILDEISSVPFGIFTLPGARLTGMSGAFVEHCCKMSEEGKFKHLV